MLKQRQWRTAGTAALLGCLLMAVVGVQWDLLHESVPAFLAYWLIFVLLLITVIYTALLDIRYIRLRFAAEKREIFRETIGEESFRRMLQDAQQKEHDSGPDRRRN